MPTHVLCLTHKALSAVHAQGPQGEHALQAFHHASKAMEFGYAESVQELAMCYAEGFGTVVSLHHACTLFLMGCKLNLARSTGRVRDCIVGFVADRPSRPFLESILVMREAGQLTDDDTSRNPLLAEAWALANEFAPPALVARANARAENAPPSRQQ